MLTDMVHAVIDGKQCLIYWTDDPGPRTGIVIEAEHETCVTDEIASGYSLGSAMLADAIDDMQKRKEGE